MSEILIVGERFNMPGRPAWADMPAERWYRLALRLGALRDPSSRLALRRIGIDADSCQSMNLTKPAPQGVPFDADYARDVAVLVYSDFARRVAQLVCADDWRIIVLCGRRVARAFCVPDRQPWGTSPGGGVVVIPHPSGLNRFWNDSAQVAALNRALAPLLTASPGVSTIG